MICWKTMGNFIGQWHHVKQLQKFCTELIDGFLRSYTLNLMDSRHRMRKTSRWCNEQHVQKLITLNRKEETDLQRKLDQLQREQNQLRREFDQDIRKTRKAFNTSKKIPSTADDSTSRVRRNSLSSVEPIKTMMNAKRRHSIACAPPASMVEEEERDNKKADEDVMFEIDNSFRFLSIAFGNKPSSPTSSTTVKLPEIQSSYPRGSSSSFKPPLMRRRQSEVITIRHDDNLRGRP